MKVLKVGSISVKQLLTIERAIRREIELENGLRINYKRVQKSKKTYSRKGKHLTASF
jgi:hypothetical protein